MTYGIGACTPFSSSGANGSRAPAVFGASPLQWSTQPRRNMARPSKAQAQQRNSYQGHWKRSKYAGKKVKTAAAAIMTKPPRMHERPHTQLQFSGLQHLHATEHSHRSFHGSLWNDGMAAEGRRMRAEGLKAL